MSRYKNLLPTQLLLDVLHFCLAYSQLLFGYFFVGYFFEHNNSNGLNGYFVASLLCYFRAFCIHSTRFSNESDPIGTLITNTLKDCIKPVLKFFLFLIVSPITALLLYLQTIGVFRHFSYQEPRLRHRKNKFPFKFATKYAYFRTFALTWQESMPQAILQTIFVTHYISTIDSNNAGFDTKRMFTMYYISIILFTLDVILKARFYCYCYDTVAFIWNMICASLDIIIAVVSTFFSIYFIFLDNNSNEKIDKNANNFVISASYMFIFSIGLTLIFVISLTLYMICTINFVHLMKSYFHDIIHFLPEFNNTLCENFIALLIFIFLVVVSVECAI